MKILTVSRLPWCGLTPALMNTWSNPPNFSEACKKCKIDHTPSNTFVSFPHVTRRHSITKAREY